MTRYLAMALLASLVALPAWAGDTVRAAAGGAVGGAVGAAIGEEVGDREGAIVGGAVGAAVGAAIATDDDDEHHHDRIHVDVPAAHPGHQPPGRHCPPGQAKKGRC